MQMLLHNPIHSRQLIQVSTRSSTHSPTQEYPFIMLITILVQISLCVISRTTYPTSLYFRSLGTMSSSPFPSCSARMNRSWQSHHRNHLTAALRAVPSCTYKQRLNHRNQLDHAEWFR